MNLQTCLTPNEVKERVFSRDVNYKVALEDVRQCWTTTSVIVDFLWNTASLILRPDAIAGGAAAAVFPVLRELGFVPAAVRPVSLSIGQTRELWRYQANVSTAERLRLLDIIMTSGPGLYVLFRDFTKRTSAPATVHLTYLKGTAIVENRRKWHLRTLAGPKVANIISYVHVSDDPADMMREMAILFTQSQRIELIAEAANAVDRTDEALRLLAHLGADLPANLLYPQALDSASGKAQFDAKDKSRILNTSGVVLFKAETRARWAHIVERGKHCKVFITGNSYDGRQATVPDDKNFSLPLDAHLIFPELGPR